MPGYKDLKLKLGEKLRRRGIVSSYLEEADGIWDSASMFLICQTGQLQDSQKAEGVIHWFLFHIEI